MFLYVGSPKYPLITRIDPNVQLHLIQLLLLELQQPSQTFVLKMHSSDMILRNSGIKFITPVVLKASFQACKPKLVAQPYQRQENSKNIIKSPNCLPLLYLRMFFLSSALFSWIIYLAKSYFKYAQQIKMDTSQK